MEQVFEISATFSVEPEVIYSAFLDSEIHTAMTGGSANCSDKENEEFSAWDGYISGKNLKLVEGKEIVQSWRTTEFKDTDDDSQLTIKLEPKNGVTELTLIHSNIPEGQSKYKQGWEDHYFTPMKEYFG